MFKKTILITLAILTILSSMLQAQGFGRGRGANNRTDFCSSCIQMPKQDVSEHEKAALIYMREEEKLARDVYLTLFEKWNFVIFQNIANSEDRHTNAVKQLLDKYEIEDPVQNDEVGVFTNVELKQLYDNLIAKGETSLLDAFIVGATIEDVDIFDLNERIEVTDNDDIKCVFNNLKQGSEKHMRSFVRQIERNGGTYEAQYISQEELDEILSVESGGRRGQGNRRRW
ncbi:DUF2202 domain-containing protein [candidate division KSB1 bacterium]|nr:DUF2202 domain-containing protein [candidate division KSB1 bacterium]